MRMLLIDQGLQDETDNQRSFQCDPKMRNTKSFDSEKFAEELCSDYVTESSAISPFPKPNHKKTISKYFFQVGYDGKYAK